MNFSRMYGIPQQSILPTHSLSKPHKTKGEYPLTRLKSSLSVTSNGKVFLFGGFDEDDVLDGNVYIYDIKSESWECISAKNLSEDPCGKVFREGHSVLSVPDQDQVIVFGGVSPNDNSSNNNFQLRNQNISELLVFDLKSKKWHDLVKDITASSNVLNMPYSRSRHAACLSPDGRTMFISGGLDNMNYSMTYDDLYSFDLQTRQWNGPWKFIPRFDHHISVHEGKVWSFGGLSNDMAHVNELISWFDLQTGNTGSVSIHKNNSSAASNGNVLGVRDHIFINPTKGDSSIVLDVIAPLISDITANAEGEFISNSTNGCSNMNLHEPLIGLYDIDKLRRTEAFGNATTGTGLLSGYSWRHSFCHEGFLYFIGYKIATDLRSEGSGFEEQKMDYVASLQLSDLGVSEFSSGKSAVNKKNSLLVDFKDLLYSGELADFHIVGLNSVDRPMTMDPTFIEFNDNSKSSDPDQMNFSTTEIFQKSIPIPTHKLILQTRWPYLRTLLSSGMTESQNNVLFLQEPFVWLQALLEYIYTDSLPQNVVSNIDTLTGLLLIANLYDLPNLRPLVLKEINTVGFDYSNVLMVWSRARMINEDLLCQNAKIFIFANWGEVVRDDYFSKLSREELAELVSEVDKGAVILSTPTSNNYKAGTTNTPGTQLTHYDQMLKAPKDCTCNTRTGNILTNTLHIIRNNVNITDNRMDQDSNSDEIDGDDSNWNIPDSPSTVDLINMPISLIATRFNNSRRTRIIEHHANWSGNSSPSANQLDLMSNTTSVNSMRDNENLESNITDGVESQHNDENIQTIAQRQREQQMLLLQQAENHQIHRLDRNHHNSSR